MKKIMFNDKYGLTEAVLSGRKTMTRRMVKPCKPGKKKRMFIEDLLEDAAYKVGEEVAVAQRYIDLKNCDAFYEALQKDDTYMPLECIKDEAGCYNKMFVKAAWMPHRIKITGVKVERLQDISDDDCMKEGIATLLIPDDYQPIVRYIYKGIRLDDIMNYEKPQEAFAALIDKVSGKGTWESNPYVFAYEFKLVK